LRAQPWVLTVRLAPPSLQDNTGDADRLLNALKHELHCDRFRVDFEVLADLAHCLRAWDYVIRCVLARDRDGWILCDVCDPQSDFIVAGLAVDLGTTRIALRLLDLQTQAVLAEDRLDNPQVEIGLDVLSRVHYAASKTGRFELQGLVVKELNQACQALCASCSLSTECIKFLSVAGNTAMTHLFLGLDPSWLIKEPYIPVVNSPGLVAAKDVGLKVGRGARMYVFPNVGSYFGGDLIAGILFSGLHMRTDLSMLVDVGTNAEVVLGNKDWLIACAGAAGPALESGVTDIGMLAQEGAIDRVTIDPESKAFDLRTLGRKKPKGICGSGLIDLVAQLYLARMIDPRGQLVPKECGQRLYRQADVTALELVSGRESATGEPLLIDQRSLDSLKKAKAAMFTVLETLSASLGLSPESVDRFFVAGAFGSVIRPASAVTIGMLPDLSVDKFRVLGNSSLGGAQKLMESSAQVDVVNAIRDRVTYLELNVNQDFMNRFSAAQFFPHTDPSRFPSVPKFD
jgi:uncharacterized 2Fe-2S/4Fe-4S cluster protein (DUF4445 family)